MLCHAQVNEQVHERACTLVRWWRRRACATAIVAMKIVLQVEGVPHTTLVTPRLMSKLPSKLALCLWA